MSEVKAVLTNIARQRDGLQFYFRDETSEYIWSSAIESGTVIDDELIETLRNLAEIAIGGMIYKKQHTSPTCNEQKLREALKVYGRHSQMCVAILAGYSCDCGFNATKEF